MSSLLLGPWLYGAFLPFRVHVLRCVRDPDATRICRALFLSGWVRNGAAWMLARFVKDDKLPGTVRAAGTKSVQEFHKWVSQRDEYARMFYREVRAPHLCST